MTLHRLVYVGYVSIFYEFPARPDYRELCTRQCLFKLVFSHHQHYYKMLKWTISVEQVIIYPGQVMATNGRWWQVVVGFEN